ncbi:MAG: metallophosphoesterase family protein [Bacteroidota bacterium]
MPNKWIIPDIHGCAKTLRALFDYYISPSKDDELYFLGDYIDRGPDSKGVIDYIMDLHEQGFTVHLIKGNHEESCVQACMEEKELKGFLGFRGVNKAKAAWKQYGGRETMQSFGIKDLNNIPVKYIEWMDSLPRYINLDNYILVHAGLNFDDDDPFEDEYSMLWIRSFIPRPEMIDGKTLIHGHVAISLEEIFLMRDKPEQFGHIDLDNGVYMAGREGYGNLVALELNSMELYSQYNLDMV